MKALTRKVLSRPDAQYGLTWYAAVALHTLQGVLLANILGVERMGIWMFLQFLMLYGIHHQFGVVQSVQRQLPLLEGQGRLEERDKLLAAGQGALLLEGMVLLLVGVGLAFSVYAEHRLGLAAFLLAVLCETWTVHAQGILKTQGNFLKAGLSQLLRVVLNLALLPWVFWQGLEGAYGRIALVWFLGALLTWYWNPLKRGLAFSMHHAKLLWSDGLPILAVTVLFGFQSTLDRLMVARHLDDTSLGLYAVPVLVMSVMLVLPGSVGQVSYPAMLREYGRDGNAVALWPGVLQRCIRVGIVATAVAGLGWLLLPPVVSWIMPDFVGGVGAARLLLPGTIFVAASIPCSYFLQTIRRQKLHAIISFSALVAQAILLEWLLGRGGGIESAAAGSSVALGLYAVAILLAGLYLVRSGRA